MKLWSLIAVVIAGCMAQSGRSPAPLAGGANARAMAELHDRYRLDDLSTRVFTHREYWDLLTPFTAGKVRKEEVGRSAEGRPLYLLSYGEGPIRVLLWSQMHGDESTASMALADLVRYLDAGDERARRWADQLTIYMVPMLNPDGAERFQRENSLGIDVNRDARAQVTPEATTLKAVRERVRPQFGFNLHDQNPRTRVGNTDRVAAIGLLAPPPDAAGSRNDVRERAARVAAVIRSAIEPLVAGHITKYDETFNPRAFGDLMQQWGTSTVLIESGGWRGDPEKQYLRKVNFVALVAALDAIADGSYARADVALYESLPENGRAARDLLIRGGTVVLPGYAPYRADIAIDLEPQRAGAPAGARIAEIGDLAEVQARDTVEATGLYIHPRPDTLVARPGEKPYLRIGTVALLIITRSVEESSERVYSIEMGVVRRR